MLSDVGFGELEQIARKLDRADFVEKHKDTLIRGYFDTLNEGLILLDEHDKVVFANQKSIDLLSFCPSPTLNEHRIFEQIRPLVSVVKAEKQALSLVLEPLERAGEFLSLWVSVRGITRHNTYLGTVIHLVRYKAHTP